MALATTAGEAAQVPTNIRGRVRAASHPPHRLPAPRDSGETFRETRDSSGDAFFFIFFVSVGISRAR